MPKRKEPTAVVLDMFDRLVAQGRRVNASAKTDRQVTWGASTDGVTPQKVIIYEVYVNGVHENTAIGKTQTNAYGQFGDNVITVIAIDEAGNRSTAGKTTLFIP